MSSMPVGLSRDLPAKRVMRAQVGGRDLVVWRAADGGIAAWDNRCPHRGMALSHGFVRGNALACLYHGWHYARSGLCSYMPSHPDLEPPDTIHAVQFGVLEQDGVIWVSTEGPVEAGSLPATLAPLRTFAVNATLVRIRDASLETPFEGRLPTVSRSSLLQCGALQIAVLQNPVSPELTHVSVLAGSHLTVERRSGLSRWCEALRRRAESSREAAA